MSTWTIDDMPESQRPKRTVFFSRTASEPDPQLKAEPPQPAAAEPDPDTYIHITEFERFRAFILDALADFPAARAAVIAAVKRALSERRAQTEASS